MTLIRNTLIALLKEQLDKHKVVVWFDPDEDYIALANSLELPETHISCYNPQRGFLALRRELELLWGGEICPRLLIYVPLASKDSHNALIEYIRSGMVLEPGQAGNHNTRLSNVARRALENTLPATTLKTMLDDVAAGKLGMDEIESLAERGQAALMGALSLIFQGATPQEIALQFLTEPEIDRDLERKSAGPDLAHLLKESVGVDLGSGDDLSELRIGLSRYLLTVEFISTIPEPLPSALQTIPISDSKPAREIAIEIVRTWRLRRDLADTYYQAAQILEAELGLGGLEWSIPTLRHTETFQRLEQSLQSLIESALTEKASAELLEVAEKRLTGFWSSIRPEIKSHWQVIIGAAQVLLQADSILKALKNNLVASVLFKRYTADDGWHNLDTFQRCLERDFHNFDADSLSRDSLLKLVTAAQHAYGEAIHSLSTQFVKAYEKDEFTLPGIIQQIEIFHDFVEPSLTETPVAYILVDAFRYEMARDLFKQLPEDWKVDLVPALATPPTITEIGMAALLPAAHRGISIQLVGPSKLGTLIGDALLSNRKDRIKWLQNEVKAHTVVTKLNKIAPLKDKRLIAEINKAGLVLVTATDEIDGLWENQPHLARQLHDHVFEQLRRGMLALFGQGIGRVIITADHGFLMGDHIILGQALDAPGGETADLHRRVWIGKGGAAIGECLRKPLSAFGLGGDLELVTPYGMSVFKVQGGSSEYFHGGLSLQELVIPVISVTPGKSQTDMDKPAFSWEVTLGSQKITTRFFTVTISGVATDLFAGPPRLRTELRKGTQVISAPISASYGFNDVTRDVTMQLDENFSGQLIPNSITLQITDVPEEDNVSLYLLDEFGASLYETSIPLEIAF
jgi:hypothetical protein